MDRRDGRAQKAVQIKNCYAAVRTSETDDKIKMKVDYRYSH